MLLLIAEGPIHGYSVISQLNKLGLNSDGVDVGMVYRTLRELEAEGLVSTKWGLEEGPPKREYQLTAEGQESLDEWVAVMIERRRLIKAFLERRRRIGGDRPDEPEAPVRPTAAARESRFAWGGAVGRGVVESGGVSRPSDRPEVRVTGFESAVRAVAKGNVVIVGVGNALKADDAAGPVLAETLRKRFPDRVFDAGQVPENYLGPIRRARPDTILLVDAADFGGAPGDVRLASDGDVGGLALGTHAAPLSMFMALAAADAGVPFHVITDTWKIQICGTFSPEEKKPGEVMKNPPEGVRVRNIYFDVTPAERICRFFTEKGVRTPAGMKRIRAQLLSQVPDFLRQRGIGNLPL